MRVCICGQRGIYSTFEQKEDGEHSKTIRQTTEGVYNTKDKILYGNTIQTIATDIEDNKQKGQMKIIKGYYL